MAEDALHPDETDDISALWGAPQESALEPPRLNGSGTNGWDPVPIATNGSDAVADHPGDSVARLAEALAGHRVDVVRRSDLAALRAEIEEEFTQQLAVALYELLSVSNERFSAVEDHIDRRLHEVAAELTHSIGARIDRLATAADAQQRMAAEVTQAARDELNEIGDRLRGPLETLAAFQRDIRHEVGRVGDAVLAHTTEATRRSEENAGRVAEAEAALSERLERSEARDTAATESLDKITESMASLQSDLGGVQEAIKALREEVSNLRGRPGARRRWGRSG